MIEISESLASTDYKADCLICAKPLAYLAAFQLVRCEYCGQDSEAQVLCQAGHYVCDACHGAPANQFIDQICSTSELHDPIVLAIDLMKNPKVKMNEPEHHFLVPAVLRKTYYNVIGEADKKLGKLKQARKRAENILGRFCGFYGACSAEVGTGIFVSLITDTTPLSRDILIWHWRAVQKLLVNFHLIIENAFRIIAHFFQILFSEMGLAK